MGPWLRMLLGLDEGEVPQGGMTRLELAGIPGGWWGIAAAIIVILSAALVILIYRNESELPAWKRAVLSGLRLVALGAVILVLLNPRLYVEIQAKRLAQTLLLVDGSGSMGIRDRHGPQGAEAVRKATGLDPSATPSRADIATAAMQKSELLEKLGKTNRLRSWVFDETLEARETADLLEGVRAGPRRGKSTHLGSAVRAALEASRAEPIAGVVVLSDGKSTGGDSLASAAAELSARGIPLHAVGVGLVDVPRNITLAELNVPEVAEVGMPVRLRVRVRASGYPGDAEVKLQRARQGDRVWETVGTEKITLREFAAEEVITLTDVPAREGRWRYLASVAPRQGEESARDNQRSADVVVASEKCRVLLVAGGPSYEFRHLRDFFLRDPGIQVSSWLQSADPRSPPEGDLPLRALPAGEDELRPFDVVVLLDPDPDSFPAGFLPALERFVGDLGGGLAFVAGEHNTKLLAGSPAGARLQRLLPVELGTEDPGHDHVRAWRPELTQAGSVHTLCQFQGAADENRRLWSILPGFYFRFPVSGLRPGATVLLRSGEVTVAAVHQAGAGRVLFLGTDDLHRWREYKVEVHEQFWSGAARFLALGKRLAGTRQASLATDRERYLEGDEVRIEAHVLDQDMKPLAAQRVTVELEPVVEESPSAGDNEPPPAAPEVVSPARRREVPLEAVASRPGWFRARVKMEEVGTYKAVLKEVGAECLPAAFAVTRPSGEMEDPAPDFAALTDLAKRTGGTFVPLPEIASVAEKIPDRTVVEVLGRKTATVWDSATLLLVFAGALVLEWSLRKRWRLC